MPANTEKILSSVYAIRAMLETDKPAAVAAALDTLTADLTDQMRRAAADELAADLTPDEFAALIS